MDREQISWLIVRAFGVYLLVQAFILLPELVAGFFTARYYSTILSSGSESTGVAATYRAATSMYRTLAVAPLLRIVLYSAVGLYMVRGGAFLVRLLQRIPHASTEADAHTNVRPYLTEQEASDMGVKERLTAAGLFHEFAGAVDRRDIPQLERILRQIHLAPDDIQAIIAQMLGTST